MERAWKIRFKYAARYGIALFGGPSVRPRSCPIFFFYTVTMNSFCIDNTDISGNMLRSFGVWSENPRNPSVLDRQCKWFSVAQELGQLIVLKCRLGTQTRRFFRKCVSVPCGASVQTKKSPRRCSNPGLWTFGPARCPLGYLGTDYNGSDCLPTRWLVSAPDLLFLHGHWRSHVQAVGWWSCGRLRTCVLGLTECVSADLMIFSCFFYYAGRVLWWMCGVLSPFS